MVDKVRLIEKLQYFVAVRLDNMAKANPVISPFKPIASRALKKRLSGITGALGLIADEKCMMTSM